MGWLQSETALMKAGKSSTQNLDVMRVLVENGANINAKDTVSDGAVMGGGVSGSSA